MSNVHAMQKATTPDWLEPSTMKEAMEMAEAIAGSCFAPKGMQRKPGDVFVVIMHGAQIGLKPMAAIQNISAINGRPAVWGDGMLALCRKHQDFEDIVETVTPDGKMAKCTVKRRGQSSITSTFSLDDAKCAGLLKKAGPWTQYPKRMLQMRARGFALRDAFPDALLGLITVEEARDLPPDLPVDENGVPQHEIKLSGNEGVKARMRAKAQEAASPDTEEASKADALTQAEETQVEEKPEAPAGASGESRGEVLRDIVQICTENGVTQEGIIDVARGILDRELSSAADMSDADCIEVRRVLLADKEEQEGS